MRSKGYIKLKDRVEGLSLKGPTYHAAYFYWLMKIPESLEKEMPGLPVKAEKLL